MIPYKVHLDDWTVSLYPMDSGRLTFTITNSSDPGNYMTKLYADVHLRRYYLGEMCAGELHPSPWPTLQEGIPMSKEALLAAEGAG